MPYNPHCDIAFATLDIVDEVRPVDGDYALKGFAIMATIGWLCEIGKTVISFTTQPGIYAL